MRTDVWVGKEPFREEIVLFVVSRDAEEAFDTAATFQEQELQDD